MDVKIHWFLSTNHLHARRISCDSASPSFFLYVVKPPVISAELVQLDSSYTSAAVSRLSLWNIRQLMCRWWHRNGVPGSPGYWPLWVVFAAPISRSRWVVDIWPFLYDSSRQVDIDMQKKREGVYIIGVHSRRIFCKLEFWSWDTAMCFTHLCVFLKCILYSC